MPDGQDPPSQSRGLCSGRVLWASRSSGEAESRHYGNSSEAGSTSGPNPDLCPRSLSTSYVTPRPRLGKRALNPLWRRVHSFQTTHVLSRSRLGVCQGQAPPTESPRGLEPPVPAWSLLDHGSGSENSLPGPFYWDLPPGSSSSLQASLESEEKSMDPQFRRAAQAAAPALPRPRALAPVRELRNNAGLCLAFGREPACVIAITQT